MSDFSEFSGWVMRWISLIQAQGKALDLACGAGRHTRIMLDRGFCVAAVDVNIEQMSALRGRPNLELIQADLEHGPWPFSDATFDGIVVSNYLHRPLFANLLASLRPGGILIYETFAAGNAEFGRPSNPDFLLQPGELLRLVDGKARVIAYEDVYVDAPKPALIQRICAAANSGSQRHFPAPSN